MKVPPPDSTNALLDQLAQLQALREAVPDGSFEDQLSTVREQASGFGGLFSDSTPSALSTLPRKHKLQTPDDTD
jgi:hypothetical protein